MAASSEGVYEGRSTDEKPGEPPALKWAIENAYTKGMAAKSDEEKGSGKTFRFRVLDIFVEGTNPPTDYVAHLGDT